MTIPQISAILGFIIANFILYRILIQIKDERIKNLKEKVEELEKKSPDQLVISFRERINASNEELKRLRNDVSSNKEKIENKEKEHQELEHKYEDLKIQIQKAKEIIDDVTCPFCNSPLEHRSIESFPTNYMGRELDDEIEVEGYSCGLTLINGVEKEPCKNKQK